MKSVSPWVVGIVGFFIVLAGVQGIILTKAFSGRPDPVVKDPYEAGLKYQEIIDQRKRGIDSEIKPSISLEGTASDGAKQVIVALAKVPESLNAAVIRARRSDTAEYDQEVKLTRSSEDESRLEALMRIPVAGLWLFDLEFQTASGVMLFSERLFVK